MILKLNIILVLMGEQAIPDFERIEMQNFLIIYFVIILRWKDY